MLGFSLLLLLPASGALESAAVASASTALAPSSVLRLPPPPPPLPPLSAAAALPKPEPAIWVTDERFRSARGFGSAAGSASAALVSAPHAERHG